MAQARSQWTILGERLVDENRHIRLSTVDVELPDGTRFTQYAARLPRCAMTLVIADQARVLLMYRHRFLFDREFGITTRDRIKTDPADESTRRIIADGAQVLSDPLGLATRAVDVITASS